MPTPDSYDRPSVAVDAVVFGVDTLTPADRKSLRQRILKVLLIQRGEPPFCGAYALPGGFLRRGETVSQAAQRELLEEAGVTQPRLIPLQTYSEPDRDPRGWIISCAFLALTRTVQLSTAQDSDAAAARWLQFDYITGTDRETITLTGGGTDITLHYANGIAAPNVLAFDHAQILRDAFLHLRKAVLHEDLIFDLMPPLFAISDLQQPYESITGRHTSPQNFRKKMGSAITETEFYSEAAAHRTAKLYRRKDDSHE